MSMVDGQHFGRIISSSCWHALTIVAADGVHIDPNHYF